MNLKQKHSWPLHESFRLQKVKEVFGITSELLVMRTKDRPGKYLPLGMSH
jgi:hypothetical protein